MGKQPNILLVFPDQVRADWVEPIADVPVKTPNARRLAERGVTFAKVWTPSPLCAPTRACLATGREYDRSPVKHNNQNVPAKSDTIYRRLAEAGYDVSTTGKLDLLKGFMDWGPDGRHWHDGESRLFDLGFTSGIDSAGKHDALFGRDRGAREPYMNFLAAHRLDEIHYADFRRREPGDFRVPLADVFGRNTPPPPSYANTDLSPLPEWAYDDNWIGQKGMDELQRLTAGDRPWFLAVNFAGPHEPLDVTLRMRERWEDVSFPGPVGRPGGDAQLQQTIRQNYAAMIELIDDWLGRYVAALEGAGALQDTLIIFASDHGEMLGDLNCWAKSLPFEASVRVPLVIAGPGCRHDTAPRVEPVSLLDMTKTFLDFAGCRMEGMEGISLRPTLESGVRHPREFVFSGLGNWRAVSDGRFKLVAGFSRDTTTSQIQFAIFDPASIEKAHLFDLDVDPLEANDVSAVHSAIRQRLADALAEACAA